MVTRIMRLLAAAGIGWNLAYADYWLAAAFGVCYTLLLGVALASDEEELP